MIFLFLKQTVLNSGIFCHSMAETISVLKRIIDMVGEEAVLIIGGHTGLRLQGVNVKDDREIDICTDMDGAYKLQEILEPFTEDNVSYKEMPWFRAHMGVFNVDGVRIEVMGDPEKRMDDGSWVGLDPENIIDLELDGRQMKVFTLESELEYYTMTAEQRPERSDIAKRISAQIST